MVAARELTWTQIPPRHYLCRQEVVLIGVRLPFMMVSLPTFLQGRHGLALCRPQSATVGVDVRRVWAAASPLIWRSPGGAGVFGGLDMADCSFDSIQLLFGPFGLRKLLALQFLQRWLLLGPLWLLQCVYRGSPLAAEFWHGCFIFTGARGLQVHFASCSTS